MSFFVHFLNLFWGNVVLDEARELSLVSLIVILLQITHVVSYVLAKDVLTVYICIKTFALSIKSWEATVAVGDINSSISGTFKDTKNSGTSSSSCKTYIKESSESSWGTINILYIEFFTIRLYLTLIGLIETKLLQKS